MNVNRILRTVPWPVRDLSRRSNRKASLSIFLALSEAQASALALLPFFSEKERLGLEGDDVIPATPETSVHPIAKNANYVLRKDVPPTFSGSAPD